MRRARTFDFCPLWPSVALLALGLAAVPAPARAQEAPAIKPSVAAKPEAAPATSAKTAAATPAAGASAIKSSTKKSSNTNTAAKTDAASAKGKGSQSIVVLVGDDPITAYEIEQRQRLMAQGPGIGEQAKARFQSLIKTDAVQERMKAIQQETIKANQGNSREEIIAIIKKRMQEYGLSLQKQALEGARQGVLSGNRQKALDQLIDEKLMMQEAKRLGVLASDEEIEKQIGERAQHSKVTKEQFLANFKNLGIDIETMKSLYKAQTSWLDAVRKRYGYEVRVTERDIDKVVATRPGDGEDDVELQLQRVTLPLPAKMDQKTTAQRYQEAENLRSAFGGCAGLAAQAAAVTGAKHENLGAKKPSGIAEPTRGLLLAARDGEMLPPSVGSDGIELWAVCGRNVVKADEKQRLEVAGELRQQQFGLYADRFLKDLRKDTPIEYR